MHDHVLQHGRFLSPIAAPIGAVRPQLTIRRSSTIPTPGIAHAASLLATLRLPALIQINRIRPRAYRLNAPHGAPATAAANSAAS
jgi:hypothetical protein